MKSIFYYFYVREKFRYGKTNVAKVKSLMNVSNQDNIHNIIYEPVEKLKTKVVNYTYTIVLIIYMIKF